jgi:aquaporin Z
MPLTKQCVAELLGSFLVTFLGAGAICMDSFLQTSGQAGIGLLGIALAHAIGLLVAVSMTMNLSGGYCNPAITLGLLFVGKLETKQALYYVGSQILGAVLAGFFLTVIFGYAGNVVSSVPLGTPHTAEKLKVLFNRDMDMQLMAMSTLLELLMTFLLTLAVFGTAIDKRTPRIGGIGVGLISLVIILFGYGFTGAAMNPARYLGTGLWEAGISTNWGRLSDFYVYLIGPVLGAVLASWVYSSYVMNEPTDAQ